MELRTRRGRNRAVGALLLVALVAALALTSLPRAASTASTVASRPVHAVAVRKGAAATTGGVVPLYVPSGNRLVPVDAALTPPRPAAPISAARRHSSGPRARLSLGRHGAARLSFTLRAGKHGAAIRTISIKLPAGIRFSRSIRRLKAGIRVARASGRRIPLTARLRRGRVTITLKSSATSVHVRIAGPAIIVTRMLSRNVRRREVATLRTHIVMKDSKHRVTRLTVSVRGR